MKEEINVGIGEIKIAKVPHVLTARGLGSCVGVSMYDPVLKLGGMAHILLPESKYFDQPENPYKFADLAIPALIEALCRESGSPQRFIVKLAGGAKMFSFNSSPGREDIGAKNIAVVLDKLKEAGLRVRARDVGGNRGRTVTLDTSTGALAVRVLGGEVMVL